MGVKSKRKMLIDVSRLVWRLWRGGLPTGIDRVCLAYLDHYRDRSRAVVQRRDRHFVLSDNASDALFDLIAAGPVGFRRKFLRYGVVMFASARRRPKENGLLYINVGHTGLDEPALVRWIGEASVRAVFLVHDLIPIFFPEYCRPGEASKHERRMMTVLESAAGVIGNSEATLNDLRSFASGRGITLPPVIAAWIAGSPVAANAPAKRLERPYFVIAGTIEGRKNHELLLHIWKRMISDAAGEVPLLVIVGQRGWEAQSAIAMLDRSPDLRGHVLELGKCDDEELTSIIKGARALLMPSFAEGFGLPVAEALGLGVPVIASDLPVFREFAGDIPAYLDYLDGPSWEQMIRSFTVDCPERERQRREMANYHSPNWSDHFDLVDKWMETLPQ